MFSAGTRVGRAHAAQLDPEIPVCKQRCGGQVQVQVRQEEAIPQADKRLHAQSGRLKCFFETAELLTGAT
jgi:hypothetical protein